MRVEVLSFVLAAICLSPNAPAIGKNDHVTLSGQQLMALTVVAKEMKEEMHRNIEEYSYVVAEAGERILLKPGGIWAEFRSHSDHGPTTRLWRRVSFCYIKVPKKNSEILGREIVIFIP